jgi:hypothetical protein
VAGAPDGALAVVVVMLPIVCPRHSVAATPTQSAAATMANTASA